MHNYKLIVAYDGTNYSGWQVQPNGVSIQELLQKALFTITKEQIHVNGSGRTDAGVHAMGQVANFRCQNELDPFRLLRSLNGLLPRDIRVRNVELTDPTFHARFSAKRKTYHYHLHLDPTENPFRRLYSWHMRHPIDLSLLKEAAKMLVGTFDFSCFSNQADRGSAGRNAVRTIYSLEVIEEPEGVYLAFLANGYLYKMVRNITGTLVEIASGMRSLSEIPLLIENRDRRSTGSAAPPHGLFLMHVDYVFEC